MRWTYEVDNTPCLECFRALMPQDLGSTGSAQASPRTNLHFGIPSKGSTVTAVKDILYPKLEPRRKPEAAVKKTRRFRGNTVYCQQHCRYRSEHIFSTHHP
ncbi:hypothetical protein A0H81_11834 [Grifola frondosa]|uniref:Uncharacterized protein n=1 Tax=Grifola frondosa TaxID=5627 RepID=A0A1C7LUJ5_GRIFR|nr:hypothetical protein A0H81_11834 [Grifola frondosa]